MKKRTIICIGREHGSGGRYVGEKLAEQLGIPFYDKELIYRTAKDHGVSEELVSSFDEQPITLSSIGFPMGIRNPYKDDYDASYYVLNDKIFSLQSQTIREIAQEGSCVIIGRAAGQILKDDPDVISVFIHADMEYKINRVMARDNYDYQKAKQVIRKTEKRREKYHNYYSGTKWSQCVSYDLSISTSKFGIDGVVAYIIAAQRL